MQNPVIVLTLAYTAGILLGRAFLYFPYSVVVLIIISLSVTAISVKSGRFTFKTFLLVLFSCCAGIAAYLFSAVWFSADHYTRLVPEDGKLHTISGRISSALDRDPDRTAFVLEVTDIDGRTVSGCIRVSVRETVTSLGYDDGIRFTGKLYAPRGYNNPGGFDYPAYLARNGIYRTVSLKSGDVIQVVTPGRGIFRKIQDWRERIRQAFLASTSGPASAVLQAMVLGEEGGLTDELRDRFLAAGVTHIISISGSHLGMLAMLCFGFIRLLMFMLPERVYHRVTLYADPKKIAAWLTLPLMLFYTLLAGGQTATVRSLMMIGAALAALILDREHALIHSLVLAALFILIDSPQALFDISFQLSFVSVFTIGSVVLLWKDLQIHGSGAIARISLAAALLAIISLSTSLVTGPLVAHYFNQFSLVGALSNMAIVPFAGLFVVPLGLFSGVLSLFTGYLPAAGLNQFLGDVFITLVAFFSRLPFAEFHPPSPGPAWLLCYGLFVIFLFRLISARLLFSLKPLEYSSGISKRNVMVVLLAALCLIIGPASRLIPGVKRTIVSFPDVGQGDCALIQPAGGGNILIDGGGSHDGRFDVGRRVLAPFLWDRGVRTLDLVILSHPHPDHMNGLTFVLNKFNVVEVWTHGQDRELPGYDEFQKVITERRIRHTFASPDTLPLYRIGNAELSVFHPARTFRSREKKSYAAENDRSLVVQISSLSRTFLFTGDIGADAEQFLMRGNNDLKCDLLKVPHHGSKSSSSEAFVSAAAPVSAIAMAGAGNRYHHPADEVIERYERIGTRFYRTDRDGAVIFKMDAAGIQAAVWNDFKLREAALSSDGTFKEELQNWKRLTLRRWEL